MLQPGLCCCLHGKGAALPSETGPRQRSGEEPILHPVWLTGSSGLQGLPWPGLKKRPRPAHTLSTIF